jgi:hypothetical protein
MPGGQPLRLGPFIGGLNTGSDPTAIADAELVTCMNMELDIDGSLVSRPPIQELNGHNSFTDRIVCLAEAIFSGVSYLIGSNASGVYFWNSGSWTLITSTFQACAAVQYADKVYLIPKPGSANPGGKWDPSGGFATVAALPQGQAAVKHKERLFVVPGITASSNASRLKFSDAGDFETFDPTNFIDVSQGDGQKLIDVTVYQDNLLLFKNQSTYVLAYDVRPADAIIRNISPTIGVNQQFNMVNYENQVYIFSQGWVYEIVNFDFQRLNTKVPFIRDDTAPTAFAEEDIFISILEDRLVCRYHRNIYVYGFRTRTWGEWESESDALHYFGPIVTIHPETGNEYYAGSCLTANRTTLQFYNKATGTTKEQSIHPRVTIEDSFTRTVSNGWDEADTGETYTVSGGSASDYSVNGTKGLQSNGTRDVYRVATLDVNILNIDVKVGGITTAVAATGDWQVVDVRGRVQSATTYYFARLELKHTGTFGIGLYKMVSGVETSLTGGVDLGAYTASDTFSVRLQVNSTTVRAKAWKTTALEPLAWTVTASDSAITTSGDAAFASKLTASNTNTMPHLFTFDNIEIGDMTNVLLTISCNVKTKNFDMAIPHQYKRLFWWGADVATDNSIMGIATPIVISFNATWQDLSTMAWEDLNTWAQPLTEPSSVETIATTGTGTARRFAKFLRSLRYRQINFQVALTTDGSTVDGPARVFSMTIITLSKQVVQKSVN